jgi:drug/metabolite transporter (DMT)-like permease
MIKLISILIVALFFEAVGVVLLSKGLKEIGEVERINTAEIRRVIIQGATNRDILLGVFFEAIFFAGLLILLAKADVSLIWPLTSLGFVLTTAAAKFIRHEDVTPLRWTGVVLIMMGAALVGWSEKQKAPPLSPVTADAGTAAQNPNAK